MLTGRGNRLAFQIAAVMLGIADAAFIGALAIPSFIPWSQAAPGPLLYVAAVITGALAFRSSDVRVPAAVRGALP